MLSILFEASAKSRDKELKNREGCAKKEEEEKRRTSDLLCRVEKGNFLVDERHEDGKSRVVDQHVMNTEETVLTIIK